MKHIKTILLALLAAVMLASCGNSDSKSDSLESSKQESPAASESVSDSSTAGEAESSTAEISENQAESTADSTAESTAKSIAESAAETTSYKNIKVMTLGDSITDGFWLAGGYRVFLCNKLEENCLSQYVDFVGSNHSGDCYDNDHEGYTAFAIEKFSVRGVGTRSGIASFAPDKIEEFRPDVLTLMIGTNDILSQYALDEAGNRLEALVDACYEKMPEGGKIFLASLPDMDTNDETYINKKKFTSESMDEMVASYNDKVKALVEKKQGEGKNIEFCDVHAVVTKADLYDGVHPSEEGYKKLADYWYDIIVKCISE